MVGAAVSTGGLGCRWEARYLLEAQRATRSKAEAWRWAAERRLLTTADSESNPSASFAKRWRKFAWRA